MKLYVKQIKPFIRSSQLQGFNSRRYPVKGYDWMPEDMETALRNEIVVEDHWATLYFETRFIEVYELDDELLKH